MELGTAMVRLGIVRRQATVKGPGALMIALERIWRRLREIRKNKNTWGA